MKRILVNMNCSGYFWHEINNTSQYDGDRPVPMAREISEDANPSISALRNYEQYDYAYMRVGTDYVLAIRNLNELRLDGSGRNLRQHIIFEDEDKDLILSLFACYLSYPKEFEEWLTQECFKPGQNSALCMLKPLETRLEQIKSLSINSRLRDCEFAIHSPQSAKWIAEKFCLDFSDVECVLNKTKVDKYVDANPFVKEIVSTDGDDTDGLNGVNIGGDDTDGSNDVEKGGKCGIDSLNLELDRIKEDIESMKNDIRSCLSTELDRMKKDIRSLSEKTEPLEDECKVLREELNITKETVRKQRQIVGVSVIVAVICLFCLVLNKVLV